jgi:hypothetical protein
MILKRPWLDGCLDVDLEYPAKTNALPVRRRGLAVARRPGRHCRTILGR